MAITIANSILKCVRIGNEQSEWIERNDINFSKFVRKLVDSEISRRESTDLEDRPDEIDLFEYVRRLVIDRIYLDYPQRTDFDNISLSWTKEMVTIAIANLNRNYTLLTRQERLVLERVGIDTGLGAEAWEDQIPKGL